MRGRWRITVFFPQGLGFGAGEIVPTVTGKEESCLKLINVSLY
jgi:hypothetical protein